MAKKLPKLDHVKYVTAKGGLYAYFNTGQKNAKGNAIYARLPDPWAIGFYDSYASHKAARTKRGIVEYTVAKLADDFMASKDFAKKAVSTQRQYRIQLAKVVETLGEFPVSDVQRTDITTVINSADWGAATRNAFVAVLGTLYKWARDEDRTTIKPTDEMGKLKTGEHDPWPAEILRAGLKAEDARIRLAVHLLYFTGQRLGDVCSMRWNNIEEDDTLYIIQEKGKIPVWIPLHEDLLAELNATPKKALTILTGKVGGAPSAWSLRKELQEFTRALGTETVPHGLRKNAVNVMLEAGCSTEMVSAITGQSPEIVRHYAKRVNRKKLAKSAILKFERATKGEQENRLENLSKKASKS